MTNRPFINFKINELEECAEESAENLTALKMIHEELQFRTRSRAKKLSIEIDRQINNLMSNNIEPDNGTCKISLPPHWFKGAHLDKVLKNIRSPYDNSCKKVIFIFPEGAQILLEAGIRILCLANQLAMDGKNITLQFEDTSAFSYLNRMEFFSHLDNKVTVSPYRPSDAPKRSVSSLVEFGEITPGGDINELPGRLTDTLLGMIEESQSRPSQLVVFTVFSEMIGNIQRHSGSKLSGYAALQVYKPSRPYAQIVVSDSGKGIAETLRPALNMHYPEDKYLQKLSDAELILEIFRKGLSREGPDEGHGIGLKTTWQQAMKSPTKLVIRQPDFLIRLTYPSKNGKNYDVRIEENLPLMRGTHITLEFYLDY